MTNEKFLELMKTGRKKEQNTLGQEFHAHGM
jgi:hypothetical protein